MDEIVTLCKNGSIFVQNLTEMSKKLPEIDESKLGMNPFTNELIIEASKLEEKGKWVMDTDGTLIPSHHVVERQKYTKLYHYSGARDRMLNMSSGALRMIVYIAYTMDGTKDWIRVTPDTYGKKAEKGSLNTYKRAIEELIRYGYITPTIYKYTYWVNPSQMFTGNRINKYPEKVIVK